MISHIFYSYILNLHIRTKTKFVIKISFCLPSFSFVLFFVLRNKNDFSCILGRMSTGALSKSDGPVAISIRDYLD